MELMSEKEFFPTLAIWGVGPGAVGWDTPKPWVAVRDLGIAIANIFEDPATWIGEDVALFGDIKSLAECKEIFVEVDGKVPRGIPLPQWLFRKMAGDEFVQMWRWLRELHEKGESQYWQEIVESSRVLSPDLLDIERWLRKKRNGGLYGD